MKTKQKRKRRKKLAWKFNFNRKSGDLNGEKPRRLQRLGLAVIGMETSLSKRRGRPRKSDLKTRCENLTHNLTHA